jgi:hypothetical protein
LAAQSSNRGREPTATKPGRHRLISLDNAAPHFDCLLPMYMMEGANDEGAVVVGLLIRRMRRQGQARASALTCSPFVPSLVCTRTRMPSARSRGPPAPGQNGAGKAPRLHPVLRTKGFGGVVPLHRPKASLPRRRHWGSLRCAGLGCISSSSSARGRRAAQPEAAPGRR